jgi:hypothetical protein
MTVLVCVCVCVCVCVTNSVCATHVWTDTTRTKVQFPSGHLSDLSSSTVLHFVSLNRTRAYLFLVSLLSFDCVFICMYSLLLSVPVIISNSKYWLITVHQLPPDLLKKDNLPVHRISLVTFTSLMHKFMFMSQAAISDLLLCCNVLLLKTLSNCVHMLHHPQDYPINGMQIIVSTAG